MNVWIVVVALLALSVLFLFISLFLKDNNHEEELDEISEGLLELNREIYTLKKRIHDLESNYVKVEPQAQAPVTPNPVLEQTQEIGMTSVYSPAKEVPVTPTLEADGEELGSRLHNITKQHIITLYSHGSSIEEIAQQLNVPNSTVQLVVDSYFEENA